MLASFFFTNLLVGIIIDHYSRLQAESVTPDVLLGRKTKQVLKPTQTLGDAQLIDDDILYLSTEVMAPSGLASTQL